MQDDLQVREQLTCLLAGFTDLDPADREALATIGALSEQTLDSLPLGLPKVPALLNLTLEVLQRLYEQSSESPTAEVQAVASVLRATEAWLAADREDSLTTEVDRCGQALWVLLGRDPELSPFPAAAAALQTDFDDLAAQLIGLSPDDAEDLQSIQAELSVAAADARWPQNIRDQAAQAVELLTVALARPEEADAALDETAAIIGAMAALLAEERAQALLQAELASAAESAPEPEAEVATEPKPEPEVVAELEPVAEFVAEPQPEPVAEVVAEPEPEPLAEVVTEPEPTPEPVAEVAAAESDEPELVCLEFTGDAELLGEFVSESSEHLQHAEVALLDLEVNPEDREAINAVFRGFHTIKGTAGFLGLPVIQKLAHHAEALLDRARTNDIKLTGGYADLALESADMLKAMVTGLSDAGPDAIMNAPAGLHDLLARLRNPESHGLSETPTTMSPPLRTGDILVAEGKVSRETVEAVAQNSETGPIGQKLVASEAASAKDVVQALRTQKQSSEPEGNVRVRTDRLDALINMVGELVIANSMLVQDEEVERLQVQALGRKVAQLNKITRELQAMSMSLRMVPLKSTFQKMARVVRDLSQKSGKPVRFVSEGEDTEIDRSMVESLGDPLLHMVRNAMDHGLDEVDQRRAAGKPETGTVRLRAYHAAGHVVIELSDDGRGLNREKIISKAVKQGVIEEGRELADAEVWKLIFAPGLSTAEKVTDVSGRGVGMDVVARNIEGLRGRIEIISAAGEGTTFIVRIPLTLAIMDGMLVRVGSERYILPTASIQQAFRAEIDSIHTPAGGCEIICFREHLFPLLRLHHLFNIPDALTDPYAALMVLVESDGESCALLVDELLGQQQIVIKSLGEGLGEVPGVSGSAILGDGRVGLILDPEGVQQLAKDNTYELAA